MSNPALGVSLAALGCFCSAVGYTFQKLAHRRAEKARRLAEEAQGAPVDGDDAHSAPEGAREGSAARSRSAAGGGQDGATGSPAHGAQQEPTAGDTVTTAGGSGGGGGASGGEGAAAASSSSSRKKGDAKAPRAKPYYKFWQFPAGILMLVAGSVFAVVVFGLAGQAQLAPMGAVTMIFNSVLAWRVLREPFSRVDAASVLLMGAGTVVALVFGKQPTTTSYSIETMNALLDRTVVYVAGPLWVAAIVALALLVRRLGRTPPTQLTRVAAGIDACGRALLGGMLGGLTGFFVKAAVEIAGKPILRGDFSPLAHPHPYLFVAGFVTTLISQVRSFNSGLARYESSRVIPPYQSSLVFSSVFAGYVFWDEVSVQTSTSLTLFGCGIVITALGMLLLMWKPRAPGAAAGPDDDEDDDEEGDEEDGEEEAVEPYTDGEADGGVELGGLGGGQDAGSVGANTPQMGSTTTTAPAAPELGSFSLPPAAVGSAVRSRAFTSPAAAGAQGQLAASPDPPPASSGGIRRAASGLPPMAGGNSVPPSPALSAVSAASGGASGGGVGSRSRSSSFARTASARRVLARSGGFTPVQPDPTHAGFAVFGLGAAPLSSSSSSGGGGGASSSPGSSRNSLTRARTGSRTTIAVSGGAGGSSASSSLGASPLHISVPAPTEPPAVITLDLSPSAASNQRQQQQQ